MERPNIPPDSTERLFLQTSNYVFSVVFATEMFVKVSIFEEVSDSKNGIYQTILR